LLERRRLAGLFGFGVRGLNFLADLHHQLFVLEGAQSGHGPVALDVLEDRRQLGVLLQRLQLLRGEPRDRQQPWLFTGAAQGRGGRGLLLLVGRRRLLVDRLPHVHRLLVVHGDRVAATF